METVKYAHIIDARHADAPVHDGRNAMGYGSRIAVPFEVRVAEGNRTWKWRRVYATCWSNVASFFIIVKGERLCVDEMDIERLVKGD